MSNRIDWRNFDYSEGPPKVHRDTNPYSKSTNYRTRESSTSSPLNCPDINSNININSNLNRNRSRNRNRNNLNNNTAALVSVISPNCFSDSNAMDNPDNIKDHKASSASTSFTSSKLSYRPPGQIQTTPFDEGEPTIPRRKRIPLGGEEEEEEELSTKPLTPVKTVAQPITPPREHEDNHKVDLRMNVPNDVQETVQLSTKTHFDALWNEGGEDWNDEEDGIPVQHYVSDDEEEGQFVDNFMGEKGTIAGTTSKISSIDESKYSPGRTIASEASVGMMEVARSTNMDRNSPGPSFSDADASVGMMEVADIMMSPVSILRSNGRFADQERENQEKDRSPSISMEGRRSSPSRNEHPLDQDKESAPMDEVAEEHEVPVDLDEESEVENTDLSQYEADDQEVAAATRDHIAEKEDMISPAHVATRKVNQGNLVPNHILRNDNTDVDRKEKRRRSRQRDDVLEREDDSIEDLEGNLKRADSLRDRTKQAWSKRNQSTGSLPAAIMPTPEIHPNGRGNNSGGVRRSLVAFQQNTVHEFVPEEGESGSGSDSDGATEVTDYTEYTHDDDDTFGGRSMHSVYTKSNESEAEDFFKDIFFVGSGKATNPGRRQIKHKKGYKEKYKAEKKAKSQAEESDDDEEASLDDNDGTEDQSTIDGSLTVPNAQTDRKRAAEVVNDDNVDGDDDDETISKTDSRSLETYDEIEADAFTMTYNYCDNIIQTLASTCGLTSATNRKSKSVENGEEDALVLANNTDEFSMVESFVDYATDAMFSHHKNAFSDEENSKALMDLAVNAAKTKHSLQNIEYDEMHDLKLQTEIKLIKTSIGLPIGLVFAETHVCCWVQKIFENGNASMASIGDKLQVGDQLAAINGITAMHKDVTSVCRILANTSNPALIELTFVRYIGPLRPASNEQQGYEVIDTKLSKGGRNSPFKFAKNLSFSRPRSPTNTDLVVSQKVIKIKAKKSPDLKRNKSVESNARSRSTSRSSIPTQQARPVQKSVRPATNTQIAEPAEKKEKKKRFRFFHKKKNKDQCKK